MRFAVLMAFLLAAASVPASSLFALQRIEVEGNRALTFEEVIAASGLAPDARSIFLINAREVAARLAAHPRIAGAEVRARAPHTIHITVRERTAVAAAPFARGYALVDAAGIVIEVQTARPAQALISERARVLTWATPGQPIDSAAVREGLALLTRLPEALRAEIAHLQISRDREVFIYLRDGLEIRGGPLRGVARYRLQQHSLDYSAGERIELYRLAGAQFLDHPVLGLGLGNFAVASNRLHGVDIVPHQYLLGFLAELGLPGLLIALGFMVALPRTTWRARTAAASPGQSALALGVWAALLGFAVHNQFESTIYRVWRAVQDPAGGRCRRGVRAGATGLPLAGSDADLSPRSALTSRRV